MMKAKSLSALNAYADIGVATSLEGASPHQVILLLFDGALMEVGKARFAIANQQVGEKCRAINHIMRIIQEGLQSSLDIKAGGDMGQNLHDLYEYMCNRLLIANMNNDSEPLEEVGRLLGELRGAWATIGQAPTAAKQIAESAPQPRSRAMSYGSA